MAHNNLVLRVPECWEQAAETAIMRVWKLFQLDQKSILTESDLKCWLFTELNMLKFCEKPFAVHTEVTHYAGNVDSAKTYSFRDLSLLSQKYINLNNEIWNIFPGLSKGFSHKGNALHFELKFSRQPRNGDQVPNVDLSDLLKINDYSFRNRGPQRKFICLIGSQNPDENIYDDLTVALKDVKQNMELLTIYYFNKDAIYKCFYQIGEYKVESIM